MLTTLKLRPAFGLLTFIALFALSARPALAQPPIWESDFGAPLADLTGEDDSEQSVNLSFGFPYDAASYTTVYAGTNGCVQLGSLGGDSDIDYDLWAYFEEFYDDGAPIICPFATDWDLGTHGTVDFHDFGDRAVFTWNGIGTNENEDTINTFQLQLYATGRIVFGYHGILDGKGDDFINDMSEGIVVGISSSNGNDPGPTDLSAAGILPAGGTKYERWCYDEADSCSEGGGGGQGRLGGGHSKPKPQPIVHGASLPGPVNTAWDLDQTNVIFEGAGPSIVEVPTLGSLGLAALALLLSATAVCALRRRPSVSK
ncbi:MAG: hypothetical protein ABI639_10575 [Thermoanaerobaculia bacterium]